MHTLKEQSTRRGGPARQSQWVSGMMESLAVVATMLAPLVTSGLVHAAVFQCSAGDVACLIAAIKTANGNGEDDTITLEAGTYTLTAIDNDTDGSNGLPSITSPLTITGADAATTIIAREASAPLFRLLHVAAAGILTLKDLTITRGAVGPTIPGSTAFGGALLNHGTVILSDCNLTENTAGYAGGALFNDGGTVTLINTTLADNIAPPPDKGGGLLNFSGTLTLQNTILARNTAEHGGPECWGSVTSLGHNLLANPTDCTISLLPSDLTGAPGLGLFTDDGTPGHGYFPLLPTSPALETGHDAACPPTDQLGQPRVGACDIGAVEFQVPPDADVVAIRHALVVEPLALLVVTATSSAAPEAALFVTVPGCFVRTTTELIGHHYLLLRDVQACGDLAGRTAVVTSSRGGSASAPLR
jgi:hypothetical protein